jgi:4-hydroxy-3-methylbut-2-en-1-yl diphosphate synthase IspG/GcpE
MKKGSVRSCIFNLTGEQRRTDVRLGGKMHDSVDLMGLHDIHNQVCGADITLNRKKMMSHNARKKKTSFQTTPNAPNVHILE